LYYQKQPSRTGGSGLAPLPTLYFKKEPSAAAPSIEIPELPRGLQATSEPPAPSIDRAFIPAAPSVPAGEGATSPFTIPVQATVPGPRPDMVPIADETHEYHIQLEPPGTRRLFRLESQASLFERMRQEARQRTPMERIQFPDEPILSRERYTGRNFPLHSEVVEAAYVCHRPLLFEEKNSERYGWDLGLLQPLVSVGAFYFDVVSLPYHVALYAGHCYDCNAGKCLPGDPVPYLIEPPQWSLVASAAEAGVLVALFAIFP
jgi:hypothetical protein